VTLGALTVAWFAAEAAKPLEWRIIGVWLDAETSDKPKTGGSLRAEDTWSAVATGPHQPADRVTGHGGSPDHALRRLADLLRERRGRRPVINDVQACLGLILRIVFRR